MATEVDAAEAEDARVVVRAVRLRDVDVAVFDVALVLGDEADGEPVMTNCPMLLKKTWSPARHNAENL